MFRSTTRPPRTDRLIGEAEPTAHLDAGSRSSAPFNFTRDVVERLAANQPQHHALTFVDGNGIIDRRTFAEVAADANRWSGFFDSRGLTAGDHVLVYVGRSPEWLSVLLGALKAGVVAVPCPERWTAAALAACGESCDAQLVVTDRGGAREVSRLDVPVEVVVLEDVELELRRLPARRPTHENRSDDLALVVYTSGTAGSPTGTAHTHRSMSACGLHAEHWLDAGPTDVVWCTAELGSASSIWNILLGPWSRGAAVVLADSATADDRLALIDYLGVTVLCLTPAEYEELAAVPDRGAFDLRTVRHAVSAGARVDPGLIARFRSAYGLTIREAYGTAETGIIIGNVPGTPVKPGSIGVPLPGHDVAVVDADGHEEPPGVEGAIAVDALSPTLFGGYRDAAVDAALLHGRWYVTDDRATRDADGYFWLASREARNGRLERTRG